MLLNMFAMGHGLHSRVRQEVGKFLKLSNSNSTSHIRTLLSHNTGGLYVQSGDNINSQDNSTETEISGLLGVATAPNLVI